MADLSSEELTHKDTIYQTKRKALEPFCFNADVAAVFDDMILRSVPLYETAQLVTALFAKHFSQPNSTIYDLGCATGTTIELLTRLIDDSTITLIGIDNSEDMLLEAEEKLEKTKPALRYELKAQSITEYELAPASVCILNYTLQFIDPDERPQLLKRIHHSLTPGGVLIISEKVKHAHERVQALVNEMHHEFKRSHGYSALEIAQKRDAIEKVLLPLSLEENVAMLNDAGFDSPELLLKSYNFATWVAVKGYHSGTSLPSRP